MYSYQFWKIKTRKINPSKSNFLRLYTLDNISTRQFIIFELIIFLPLVQNSINFVYQSLELQFYT
jgi:hypothetical protein